MQVESELEKSSLDICDVMKLLLEMRQENKGQTKNLELELGKSIELCHQTISELRKTVDSQSEALNKYKDLYEQLLSEHKRLLIKFVELETRQDEAEQYSRLNTIEINGIPENENENVFSLVQQVGNSLNIQVKEEMVDVCDRLGGKCGERPRGIVAKFTRRTVKEEFLQKRRVKRNLNTSDIGFPSPASVIYVNESLTPIRRRIFNEVRSIKKEKGFTFVWIRNGKIMVRPSEGDKVSAVSNWNDVEKLRKLPATTGSPQAPGNELLTDNSTNSSSCSPK
ncbi:uncharacterized protein LOC124361041 [Homalodisca vitripennis]|uniref:uncharacterized protein LOC124361041 n=1 Tax=Homalodisca vitripennis TaxID=197043 RepID=UPI001EEBD527|nr:uncharacterized protein LOC124361041 [Homalodisca vitripennis]